MLKILPKLTFPLTASSINPLMDGLVQVNSQDAGLQEAQQRALVIYLHCIDLYVKSKGAIDYRGVAGHERLKTDAVKFVPSQIVTRHGDLSAAHLTIDFSETTIRSMQNNLPLPNPDVNFLVNDSRDLLGLTLQAEKQISLMLDILGMRKLT